MVFIDTDRTRWPNTKEIPVGLYVYYNGGKKNNDPLGRCTHPVDIVPTSCKTLRKIPVIFENRQVSKG